ncbi:MAG: hypothetical protein ACYS99_10380 [Planctomycetota bacterium]|jgi:hypothetical protein
MNGRIPFGGAARRPRRLRTLLYVVLFFVVLAGVLVYTFPVRRLVPPTDPVLILTLVIFVVILTMVILALRVIGGFGRFRILNGSKNKKVTKLETKVWKIGDPEPVAEEQVLDPPLLPGECDDAMEGPPGHSVDKVEIKAEIMELDTQVTSEVSVVLDNIGAEEGIRDGRLVLCPNDGLHLILRFRSNGEWKILPED